jgi:hypothetical protein
MHPPPSEIFFVYILSKNHILEIKAAIRLFDLKFDVFEPNITPYGPHGE